MSYKVKITTWSGFDHIMTTRTRADAEELHARLVEAGCEAEIVSDD